MTVDDPFLRRWLAARPPAVAGRFGVVTLLEHEAAVRELEAVDTELEDLCARRRAALGTLRKVQARRWPSRSERHGRRPQRVDQVPLPPVPAGAVALDGTELRRICVGLLRRHGPCSLRELHGLLHRYGYEIDHPRAVQRLADAMAYEVRQDRCMRVRRGVYRATTWADAAGGARAGEPCRWSDPDPDVPPVSPELSVDVDRWSAGTHPPHEAPQARVDDDMADPARYPPATLDDDVAAARARVADLVDLRRRRPTASDSKLRADDATPPAAGDQAPTTDDPRPGRSADAAPGAPVSDAWERFVDESFPSMRRWSRGWQGRAGGEGQVGSDPD